MLRILHFTIPHQQIIEEHSERCKKYSEKYNAMSRIQKEKYEISKIMATAFNANNEIGGKEKDTDSIKQCDHLIAQLRRAKIRYKYEAIAIQIVIRMCVLLTIVTTTITVGCVGGDKEGYMNDVKEKDKEGFCKKNQLDTIILLSLLLPFTAATVQAIEKTLRPYEKYAILLRTHHRLESEKYKFRARIGIYNSFASDDPMTIVRSRFTQRCSVDIYEECMDQDFKEGTLKSCCFSSSWEWVSPFLSKCCIIFDCVFSTCSALYSFLRCKPKKSWKIGSQVDNLIPHNWLRRLFTGKETYRRWQTKHYVKKVDAYKEEKDLESQENIFAYNKLGFKDDELLEGKKEKFEEVEEEIANENTKLKDDKKRKDNRKKYKIIAPDTYFELRMIPVQETFETILPRYIFWRNVNHIIIIGFTALSTLLVSLNMELWVPLSLGIAAAADAFLNFYEYEGKAPVMHTAISELKMILIEFKGLGFLEQRLPRNAQLFIERSEDAILSYYEYVAEMALNSVRDTPEDDTINEQSKKIIENMKQKNH